jgi:hypothetical protein
MSRTRTTREELALARRALRVALRHLDRAAHLSHLRPTRDQAEAVRNIQRGVALAAHLAATAAGLRDMTTAEARRVAR